MKANRRVVAALTAVNAYGSLLFATFVAPGVWSLEHVAAAFLLLALGTSAVAAAAVVAANALTARVSSNPQLGVVAGVAAGLLGGLVAARVIGLTLALSLQF